MPQQQVYFFSPDPKPIGFSVIFSSYVYELARLKEPLECFAMEEAPRELKDIGLFVVALAPIADSVTRTKHFINALLSQGISREKICVCAFDVGIPGGLPLDLIEEALGLINENFAYEPLVLLCAQNQGRYPQELFPKSQFKIKMASLMKKTMGALESPILINPVPVSSLVEIEKEVATRLWKNREQTESKLNKNPDSLRDLIGTELHEIMANKKGFSLSSAQAELLVGRIFDQLTGLGPLEELMYDDSISEIMVNGPHQIFVERKQGLEAASQVFVNENQLKVVINRVVSQAGRRVDTASPLVDIRLQDGSRANVVLPPVSLNGPVLSIRRFRPHFQKFEDLVGAGSLTLEQVTFLQESVRGRKNIVVAGNSGSGKTTLLNILSRHIDPTERLITIEDAAELQIQQSHVVRLESRPKNAEGVGEISTLDLVVNALRMRPDRLIVGEVRGVEVIPMLQAMNTGHHGSMTTLHANSALDALYRLEALVLLGAPQWPVEVIRQQIATGVHEIVFLSRVGSQRKCEEIVRVKYENGILETEKI